MPYFSAFWYKHYKESPTCDRTDPLVTPLTHIEKPRKPEAAKLWTNPGKGYLVIDFIDTNWMYEKGFKALWYDVYGYRAWTDASGMIYRIKDLKRNELGKKYEDEKGPVRAHADGSDPKPSYLTNKQYYTAMLNNRKKLCEGGGGGGQGSELLPLNTEEEKKKNNGKSTLPEHCLNLVDTLLAMALPMLANRYLLIMLLQFRGFILFPELLKLQALLLIACLHHHLACTSKCQIPLHQVRLSRVQVRKNMLKT